MTNQIMDYLMIAKDIVIRVLFVFIIFYIIYKIIMFIMGRKAMTAEVIIDCLYDYNSYIKIDSNMNFIKSRSKSKEVYNVFVEKVLTEEIVFKKLIDKYVKTMGFSYLIFSEYSDLSGENRNADIISVKLTLFGNIQEIKIENKTGDELEYLNNN